MQTDSATCDIAIIMTCHNRKNTTLACLKSLFNQSYLWHIRLTIYLVDDGSSDGTSEAVSGTYPSIHIIRGSGDLYWNRGMHRGFAQAIQNNHGFYLWLNDDVILTSNTVQTLLNCYARNHHKDEIGPVIVGAFGSEELNQNTTETSEISYAGIKKTSSRWFPRTFRAYSSTLDLACDTFLGNGVLIPSDVALKVGNINPIFHHALGDMDYGYRCASQSIKILVCKEIIGYCTNDISNTKLYSNMAQGTWTTLPLVQRLNLIMSPKNFPLKGWLFFSYRYLGWLWLIRFAKPYILAIFPNLISHSRVRENT